METEDKKSIKVGKSDLRKQSKTQNSKDKISLWCPWCESIDNYWTAKHDQPICKKCGRFVPKRKWI